MTNNNLKVMDELLDNIRSVLDNTCCICVNDIPEGSIKHKIDRTSTICDSCWNKLKTMMDQEE